MPDTVLDSGNKTMKNKNTVHPCLHGTKKSSGGKTDLKQIHLQINLKLQIVMNAGKEINRLAWEDLKGARI